MKKRAAVLILGLSLLLPFLALAKLGVGVGTGKIQVDKPLKPGFIYNILPVTVFNTGDEAADFGIGIEYRENIPQLRPEKEWFSFKPEKFHLEPGQSKMVEIQLTLPVKGVKPGDYFCFLSGYPIQKSEAGVATVGIAAATKLYFTVAPANIFQGIYYRFVSLYTRYHPWDTIVLTLIALAIVIRLIGKKFKIQIAKR